MDPSNAETAVPTAPGEVTRLLRAWNSGGQEVRDRLWSILYDELKKLAASVVRGRRTEVQATSLLHEAYLRLLGSDVEWNDRRHFFAIAARAMRFVLAAEARRRLAGKRGGGATVAIGDAFPEIADPLAYRPEEVLMVHQAMEKLAVVRPRHATLVELRYFAGLSVEETAEILEVTTRTVVRDWKAVRIWLHGELGNPV